MSLEKETREREGGREGGRWRRRERDIGEIDRDGGGEKDREKGG